VTRLETRDLYEGAFYLTQGAELAGVEASEDGSDRKKVTFLFEGEGVEGLRASYRAGRALVEVTRLRAAVNHLRDVLFDTLRKSELVRERKGDGRWTTSRAGSSG